MSRNNPDQIYIDACQIVDAYERAVRYESNEMSILITMESHLDFMEEILESSESALNEMNITDDDPASIDSPEGNSPQQNQNSEEKEQNSCAEEKSLVSMDGPNIFFNTEPASLDASLPLIDPINAIDKFFGGDGEITAKDIQDSARECFDCDLKVEFDFQIKPINLLAEIMPLLNKIGAICDNVINELKPFDLLANLCNISKNIKLFCLPDLLSILVTLEGLIKRYMGESFKLVLNWTFIIGPLIKGIVDIAATLMEQIRRLLVAPLDCAAGVIGTLLNFNEGVKNSIDNFAAFAVAFPKYDRKIEDKVLDRTMKFAPQPELNDMGNVFRKNDKEVGPGAESPLTFGWEFSINDTLESKYQKEKEQIKVKRRLNERKAAAQKVLKKDPRKAQSFFEKAGKTVTGDENFNISVGALKGLSPTETELVAIEQEMGRLAKQEDQGMLKNLLFLINSGKDWINSLHANLLLSLKALNSLVANNLEISFKLGGWILMIFDMIKVIQLAIHFFKGGNFKDMCDIMENDPELLKDILERDFKWAAVNLDNTQKKLDEWERVTELFITQEELITCE